MVDKNARLQIIIVMVFITILIYVTIKHEDRISALEFACAQHHEEAR